MAESLQFNANLASNFIIYLQKTTITLLPIARLFLFHFPLSSKALARLLTESQPPLAISCPIFTWSRLESCIDMDSLRGM